MNEKAKSGVVGGLVWTFGERILAQFVSTLVGIILARILIPEDYGVISIVMIFISFCNVFVTSGFGAAIVQKKEADILDFNTAFFISLFFSIILYSLLFISSPFIADFYDTPLVSPVIRVLGLRLILTSLNTLQQASIRRQMNFKLLFVASIFGTTTSCFVGIVMACLDFGAWAIVAQYLTNTTISSIIMCFVCGWNPTFSFSFTRAKTIFSVSWKLLLAQLISTLSMDIRILFVGKAIGTTQLAFYDQGLKYPSLLITNINSAINTVMLPAYSNNQENILTVKEMLRKSIRIGMYLVAPIMIGLFAVSGNFVKVILTDKWLPMVPLMQVFCLSYLTRPLETSCRQAIIAIGHSEIALRVIATINIVCFSATFVIAILTKEILYIAFVSLLETIVSLLGFMISAKKLLFYNFSEQIKDMSPSLLTSFFMGVIVLVISYININRTLLLILQIICGAVVYLVLSAIFKLDGFLYLLGLVTKKLKRKI